MTTRALILTGRRALPVANDIAVGSPYRAKVHRLPPGGSIPARTEEVDTLIFVQDGTVQMMVGGIAGYLSAGEHARVARGTHYAYRNAGPGMARLLVMPVVCPARARRRTTVTIDYAAA